VSRRRNYGFDRRQKALTRQARQEAKRERKISRAESATTGPEMGEAQDSGAPAGTWEWFSPSRSRTVAAAIGEQPDAGPPDDWVLLTDVAADPDQPNADGDPDEAGPSRR
jgi:hypothetical protein